MKANRIHLIPTSSILVTREARQRSDLTSEGCLELAQSIAKQRDLIQPISIDGDTSEIIAGERRLTAFRLLEAAQAGDYSSFTKPVEVQELLSQILPNNPPYSAWTKIPAQLYTDISEVERMIIEFVENHAREDISWQDKGRAAYNIHKLLARDYKGDGRWGDKHTATELSIATSYFSRIVTPFRALEVAHEEIKSKITSIVTEAPSARSAELAIERVVSRRAPSQPGLRISTSAQRAAAPPEEKKETPKAPDASEAPKLLSESILLLSDFRAFAADYEDEPFNFVHCDFPYGIGFNQGAGQSTSVLTKLEGNYNDSEEVYWELLSTLLASRDTLLTPSAHIMFWFSQNHRRATEDLILDAWPDAVIQPHMLIWHMEDGSGITPDPQRYGRRTYETALLITLGDRKVVSPRALSVSVPRGRDKIHRSQKPIQTLTHFFSMFVDSSTRMLDPTAGSATSLLSARSLHAQHVLGLEIDPETHARASAFINSQEKAV